MVFHATYQIGVLDRIAYHVLAVSYSAIYVDNFNVQRYIGQPCVAVASNYGCLYIAANNVWRTQGPGARYAEHEVPANVGNANALAMICHGVRAEGINVPIRFLRNPLGESDTSYHAELQLIDYVYTVSGSQFDGNVIGVSKPCCQICANELVSRGVSITDFHGGNSNAQRPAGGQMPDVFGYC